MSQSGRRKQIIEFCTGGGAQGELSPLPASFRTFGPLYTLSVGGRRLEKLSDIWELGSDLSVLPGGKTHGAVRQLWRLNNLPATGSELCFCSDPQVIGIASVTKGGAPNHCDLYCLCSLMLKLPIGSMSDLFLYVTTSHGCLPPRHLGGVFAKAP
jgi:hypothetical protein